jgi:hypothetical protein
MNKDTGFLAYVDASFAVHGDFESHTGGAMTYGTSLPISISRKQKLHTRSSTEAELVAVDDVSNLVLSTRVFLDEQGYRDPASPVCHPSGCICCQPLGKTHGRLSLYPWNPTVRDVIFLGFFIGAVPHYQSSTEFTASVRQAISTRVGVDADSDSIPPFQCVISKISSTINTTTYTCHAFDLQVERGRMKSLQIAICKTFPEDSTLRVMF